MQSSSRRELSQGERSAVPADSKVDTGRAYVRRTKRAPIDLRLDANEGPEPAPELLRALGSMAPDELRRYPDPVGLERSIARRLSVDSARVLVTAGADDGIDRLCRLLLRDGGELILPSPTFEMFERYAQLAGGRIRRVGWPEGEFPVAAALAMVDSQTRAIAVVSPNNPTGAAVGVNSFRRMLTELESLPHPPVLIVDAAYAEFADEDLCSVALSSSRCVILRSFSKAWGLAGLRVGYAVAEPELIGRLRAAGPPYAVSGPSLAMAHAALCQFEPHMRKTVECVKVERQELHAQLTRLGVHALPSQANFVLARPEDPGWLDDALQGQGIAIRSWPRSSALAAWVRIGCPAAPVQFARLQRALQNAVHPQALLLDMDGVIADESESYRESILQTLRSWKVERDRDDIAALKAEGNANNDWELTHRLLRGAGIDVPLQEVIERFEEIYQGTAGVPGLCERELLIPPKALLERLAHRIPLGIVTGRPRRDAERFLERAGLRPLFGAIVTMEDAPLKPSPAPVHIALRQLGVDHAWMIGDTPDDVRAARAAGILPLGVLAPGCDDALSFNALLDAGAARVLDSLSDVEVLLT